MAVETGGVLEVGIDDGGNVVVNHPDLKPDTNGVGHIVFSPQQARAMARLLMDKADEAARATWDRGDTAAPTLAKALPPVDRSKRCMLSGAPETPDHRDMLPNGQQKDYVVLCPEERAKGYVRPVRRSYIHRPCGTLTTMGLSLAQTYARDPGFYSGTFCCACAAHFPLDQFVWEGTTEQVGS